MKLHTNLGMRKCPRLVSTSRSTILPRRIHWCAAGICSLCTKHQMLHLCPNVDSPQNTPYMNIAFSLKASILHEYYTRSVSDILSTPSCLHRNINPATEYKILMCRSPEFGISCPSAANRCCKNVRAIRPIMLLHIACHASLQGILHMRFGDIWAKLVALSRITIVLEHLSPTFAKYSATYRYRHLDNVIIMVSERCRLQPKYD